MRIIQEKNSRVNCPKRKTQKNSQVNYPKKKLVDQLPQKRKNPKIVEEGNPYESFMRGPVINALHDIISPSRNNLVHEYRIGVAIGCDLHGDFQWREDNVSAADT